MVIIAVQKSAFRVESIKVTIGHTADESAPAIRAFALEAAGETTASTFGSHINRVGDIAIVSIHRD